MRPNQEAMKREIVNIISDEDALVHIVMNYIAHVHSREYYGYRKDGTPDMRNNIGRLVVKLNKAIGDVMWITKER